MEKQFPNGFTSWMETHHEIVSVMSIYLNRNKELKGKIGQVYEEHGTGGMYELAEDLTDKFEELYGHKEWQGDFFDTIEEFATRELGIDLVEHLSVYPPSQYTPVIILTDEDINNQDTLQRLAGKAKLEHGCEPVGFLKKQSKDYNSELSVARLETAGAMRYLYLNL